MTGSKLAIADKKEILHLYCETDVSTTQLAKQYGISSSTVLRLLQELLTPEEYRQIVSQKQARTKKGSSKNNVSTRVAADQLDLIASGEIFAEAESPELPPTVVEPEATLISLQDDTTHNSSQTVPQDTNTDEILVDFEEDLEPEDIDDDVVVNDIIGDEFDDDSDDDLLDEEDEDDEDLEDIEDVTSLVSERAKFDPTRLVKILPLDDATLPDICYLVIDKSAEVIARPLQDFRDLGKIPPEENYSLTIPVFESHHIARRFSNHNQRVIKFPSGLLYATHGKLVQKGITRLLFDGRVYAL